MGSGPWTPTALGAWGGGDQPEPPSVVSHHPLTAGLHKPMRRNRPKPQIPPSVFLFILGSRDDLHRKIKLGLDSPLPQCCLQAALKQQQKKRIIVFLVLFLVFFYLGFTLGTGGAAGNWGKRGQDGSRCAAPWLEQPGCSP